MPHNFIAVIAALIASYIAGSLWYLALGGSWRSAVGWDASAGYRPTPVELLVGFIGQALMAVALAWLMKHIQIGGIVKSVELAVIIWLGFIAPSLATNVVFQRRDKRLIWQDGLHWLLILIIQGAVLGALS